MFFARKSSLFVVVVCPTKDFLAHRLSCIICKNQDMTFLVDQKSS